MEYKSSIGPTIIRNQPQSIAQIPQHVQTFAPGISAVNTVQHNYHPSTTAKDDRLQYLAGELSFLQAHVQGLAQQAADVELQFDGLANEIYALQTSLKQDSVISADNLILYRQNPPTPQDRDELLAIVEHQRQLIENLKKKKKTKKLLEEDKEEVPRSLDVNREFLESQTTVETHQIEFGSSQRKTDFSTFGKLPEESQATPQTTSTRKKVKTVQK